MRDERHQGHDTDSIDAGFSSKVFPAELGNIRRRRELVGVDTGAIQEHLASLVEPSGDESTSAPQGSKRPDGVFSRFRQYGTEQLDRLKERRRKRQQRVSEPPVQPTTKLGLKGLALSGGGVRSASFNLGVLQVLAERGLLRDVDYLSTVSGGGYIGSTLTTVLNSPDIQLDESFPFRHQWGEQETGAFRHLRNCANYLHPGELLEKLRIPSLMFLGVFSNLVLIVPYILLAAGLTYLAHNAFGHDFWEEIHGLNYDHSFKWTSIAWLVVAAGFLLFPRTQRASLWSTLALAGRRLTRWARKALPAARRSEPAEEDRPVKTRSRLDGRSLYERLFGVLVLLACFVTLVESQPLLIHRIARLESSGSGGWTVTLLATLSVMIVLVVIVAASISKVSAPWAGRVALVGFGFTGPVLLWLAYAGVCVWGPFNRTRIDSWNPEYGGPVKAGLLYIVEWTENTIIPWTQIPFGQVAEPLLFFASGLVVLVAGKLLIDVNDTSLNSFYRDRLSRAYLFYVDREGRTIQDTPVTSSQGRLPPVDELKLSRLNGPASAAPYHLLNATLNVQRSRARRARNRRADFFLFSKEYVGGALTGYCRTRDLEDMDSGIDLGTAMAISGAAAAPSIASGQAGAMVFLLALLNVRLGYWLINPAEVRKLASLPRWRQRLAPRVGPSYFLRELVGRLDENTKHVYLSDGGHLENLGAFELLRRRCERIIICDAESDPEIRFGALSRLIRYARVDLGCNIEIDLDRLRLDESGVSAGHCAIGTIHYGNGERGELLYVKLSVTGDESETIREYRATHPRFPHESTTNQFFTEAQFEAYRHLGWHIAKEVVDRAVGSKRVGTSVDGLDELFDGLRFSLDPAGDRTASDLKLQRELSAIEARFSDERLASYSRELYPELSVLTETDDPPPTDARGCQQVMHLCNQQLHFIERVFTVKELGDPLQRGKRENGGWIALFRRWTQAPTFRFYWGLHLGRLDSRFRRFCAEELGLDFDIGWFPESLGESDDGSRRTAMISVQGEGGPTFVPIGYLETASRDSENEGDRSAHLVIDERYYRRSLVRDFQRAARDQFELATVEERPARLNMASLPRPKGV
jgi:hypothetical protein